MFRLDEFAIDLHTPYRPDGAPPRWLWPPVRAVSRPFRVAGLSSTAAVEIGPIVCMGRVIDLLTGPIAAELRAEPVADGRIVEEDPHEAFLARGGLHARVWTRRSGGFMQTAETS